MLDDLDNSALPLVEGHTGPIDLLLPDVVMPGMTGKKLAQRGKALRPDMKVLFMAGYTENVIVHQGVLEPGIAFVSKPPAPLSLVTKVRETLDAQVPPASL